MIKIVLDTNVLVSGFKDDYSFEKRIIDEVVAGKLEAYANRQTVQENKLLSVQLIDSDEYQNELKNFFKEIHWVQNRRSVHIVRDPEDNKILESAFEAKADYLITSDNDLLVLEKYGQTKIVTPQQFWHIFQEENNDLWKQWTHFIKSQ